MTWWVTLAELTSCPRRYAWRTDTYTCIYCGTRRTNCEGWWKHTEAYDRRVRLFWIQRLTCATVLVWLTWWLVS